MQSASPLQTSCPHPWTATTETDPTCYHLTGLKGLPRCMNQLRHQVQHRSNEFSSQSDSQNLLQHTIVRSSVNDATLVDQVVYHSEQLESFSLLLQWSNSCLWEFCKQDLSVKSSPHLQGILHPTVKAEDSLILHEKNKTKITMKTSKGPFSCNAHVNSSKGKYIGIKYSTKHS